MKLDFTKIHEVDKPYAQNPTPKGGLRLQCSDPFASIFVTGFGVEVLAGVGQCELTFSEDAQATFRVVSEKGCRAFLTLPQAVSYDDPGEVFTNVDRKPHESGTIAEITRKLREFSLIASQEKRQLRDERRKLRREMKSVSNSDPDPTPVSSDPVPVQDDVPSPDNDSDPVPKVD